MLAAKALDAQICMLLNINTSQHSRQHFRGQYISKCVIRPALVDSNKAVTLLPAAQV